MTLNELYKTMLKSVADGRPVTDKADGADIDKGELDCLLHPEKCAPVVNFGQCSCKGGENPCESSCIFDAISRDESGNVVIDPEKCSGCAACIDACKSGKMTASRDVLPALYAVKNAKGPVYAMIAPAFMGQFSHLVTPGKLRSAFKKLGFSGMVEVALFADILTLKEALEFDRSILQNQDYMITSCCCPVWIAMLRKIYSQLMPHVPGSVSPMIACGRSIKRLENDAVTVFIGPCIAKKKEARERDVADAVDFVLTFEEMHDIFEAFRIDPAKEPDEPREHSSKAGRIYARSGGVSEAVKSTLEALSPGREITLHSRTASGTAECKELLAALRDGEVTANFLEGMGCVGGCVGGPKAMLDRADGRENVNYYASLAMHENPAENPYVIDLLNRLGFDSVERLLEESDIFTRHFDEPSASPEEASPPRERTASAV